MKGGNKIILTANRTPISDYEDNIFLGLRASYILRIQRLHP